MKPKARSLSLSQELLIESRIPRAFWPLGRDTYFGGTSALATVEQYLKSWPTVRKSGLGLLLYGPRRSCRTFLLTYCLKQVLATTGQSVTYCTLEELVTCFFARTEGSTLDTLALTSALLAVDVIKTPANPWYPTALERVCRARVDGGLPTLLATDLELADFTNAYGADGFVENTVIPFCEAVECPSVRAALAESDSQRKEVLRSHAH